MDNNKGIVKEILNTGIPTVLETLFTTFAGIIDSKMVSAMGVTAISAVSVTNQPRLFVFSIFFALNTVVSSLVAKSLGENDRDKANRIFDHVLKLVILLSILLGAVSVLLARPIMFVVSHQEDTMDASVIYFRIVMGGMIFNVLFMAINAALRGCGLTKLTFATSVLSCVVNIFFNYLLIEGHWGFPALGIAGAAIATVMGNFAALILCLCFVCKTEWFINIPYCLQKRFKMTKDSISEITQLAKSTVTDNLVMRVSLLLISMVVARIGSFQMAVYSVGMHLMNVNFALGSGFQTSGVALIGRTYGEGDKEKIKEYVAAHKKIAVISGTVLGIAIILGGKWFFGFFSDDPEFIRLGAISSVLIGIDALIQVMKFVYSGFILGVGDMKDSMKASVTAFAGVNLPIITVTVLLLHAGLSGVWAASIIAQTVQWLLLRHFYKKHPAFQPD